MMFPLFVSCYKWDPNSEMWVETGSSVNLSNVDFFRVRERPSLSGKSSYSFECCYHGDPPTSISLVSGATDQDHACRLAGALLVNAGIPHYPALPAVEIEREIHPGGLKPPAGSQN